MTDILLVHPALPHDVYGDLAYNMTAIEPPLWCRLIGGYLRKKGWDVAICDMEAENTDLVYYAIKHAPRVIAICVYGHQPSASTQQMVAARAAAQCLKDNGYTGVVVMLGNHPSALPERTLMEEPIDYVIDGEGFTTLDELLRYGYDNPHLVPGLVWRNKLKDNKIAKNLPAPLINLDELTDNAWDLLPDVRHYRAHMWQCLDGSPRSPYAAIYTSLGCPYKCDFCMINVFQHDNKYRMRDVNAIGREIISLYYHGVRTFKIIDELFVLNHAHYKAICSWLVKFNPNDELNIWAYARVDTINKEDLPLLRRAGIKWLALGIESGDWDVREQSRKKLKYHKDNLDITIMVRAIKQAGINVIGNYIFGLPNDTYVSMAKTYDLAQTLNTEFANFYCAMPYPGSPLYDRIAKERPEDLPPSWGAYSQHNRHTIPLRSEHLSAKDILRFRDNAFIRYYSGDNYRNMIKAKFGDFAIEVIDEMLSHKLERDLLK